MIARRHLLAGAGGTALTGSATVPAAHPVSADAELLAACEQFLALQALWDESNGHGGLTDSAGESLTVRWYSVLRRITGMRPQTIGGLVAKVNAALVALRTTEDDPEQFQYEEAAALAALADVVQAIAP